MIFEPSFDREIVHVGGEQYNLQGRLGESSHSAVFLAETQSGAQVVIKRFKRNNPNATAMFRRALESQQHMLANADAVSAVDLPRTHFIRDFTQVVDFHDGVDMGQAYDLIRISISEIRDLIKAVAANIEILAKANLVHRDIKPENIVLTQTDEFTAQNVKLIDTELLTSMDHTEKTYAVGSPLFIPPECIPRQPLISTGNALTDAENNTPAKYHITSDFHSLGFVAYELFPDIFHRIVSPLDASGDCDIQKLFQAKAYNRFFYQDAMQRMEWHYIPKVQPLDRPGVRAIFKTILALTQADPGKRPQSAQEISELLEEKGDICNYYEGRY